MMAVLSSFLMTVLVFLCFILFIFPATTEVQITGSTRDYQFDIQMTNVMRLCESESIVTVNGQFPGPKLVVREGDRVIVRVVNHVPYNINLHWEMRAAVYTAAPYAVMTLRFMGFAGLMAMLQSTLDSVHGVNSVVLTAYQQLVSTSVLVSLTLFFDHGIRKPSLQILSWTCLIGLLQITVAELLLTSSLRYITVTVQSIGLNIIPVAVFVLAVLVGREKFAWGSLYEQGKLWGVITSVVGATLVVLASDSDSSGNGGVIGASHEYLVGVLMVAVAVLVLSAPYILVEKVAIEYSSDLALSAMINLFGMIQTIIYAVLTVRNPSSWKINSDSLELLAILYGGIVVTGIFNFGQNWCIHTKGPVFVASFHPLLVVFSFIFEILFFQSQTINTKSVIGAVLVVGGLYLLLWAKTRDHKERVLLIDHNSILESSSTEPLIVESRA